MAGELLAFRRAGVGAAIANYGVLVDRARVNLGGSGTTTSSTANTTTSTSAVTVTGGVANTKGDYVELISSTSHDAEEIVLTVMNNVTVSGNNTNTLLDLATGAAASEVDLVANINIGWCRAGTVVVLPIKVAAGTRLSARCQGVTASQTVSLVASLRQGGDSPLPPASSCTTMGTTAANSGGLALTVPGSTNTKSDWTEVVASAAADFTRLVVTMGGANTTGATAATGLVDIGIGAGGSETVIIGDVMYELTAAEVITHTGNGRSFLCKIPAGTRIAARYQATATASTAGPRITILGFA